MRFFYEIYSTRRRADLLLTAADIACVSTVVAFATGVLGSRAPGVEIGLLFLWAGTPRCVAKAIARFDRPAAFHRALAASLLLTTGIVVLLVTGWDLVQSVSGASPGCSPTPLTLGLMFCAWGAGFLVLQSRTYRLADFFLAATIASGLKDGLPDWALWLPLFFGAIAASSAVRHLLHNVFSETRTPPLNLQNARVIAAAVGIGGACIFLALSFVFGGGTMPENSRVVATAELHEREARRLERRDASARGGSSSSLGDSSLAPRAHGAPGDAMPGTARRTALTTSVALHDLAKPNLDAGEVLRVRAVPNSPAARRWRPAQSSLWKAMSFSTFDPPSHSWSDPAALVEVDAEGRIEREIPADVAETRETESIELLYHVVQPVFAHIATPYFTREVRTTGEFAPTLESVVLTLPGRDLYSEPQLETGAVYATSTLATDDIFRLPIHQTADSASIDPLYSELPTTSALGFDFAATARGFRLPLIGTVAEKVDVLKTRFREDGYVYSNAKAWESLGASPLENFFRERRGDCTYFATAAALLLRSAGVPTRLAAGFLGGEWDPERHEVVIRNQTAHAWVEVHVPGSGWYPLDPTRWVKADSTSVLPSVSDGFEPLPPDPHQERDPSEPTEEPEVANDGSSTTSDAHRRLGAREARRPPRRLLPARPPPPKTRLRSFVSIERSAPPLPEDDATTANADSTAASGGETSRASTTSPAGDAPNDPSSSRLRLSKRWGFAVRVLFVGVIGGLIALVILSYLKPAADDEDDADDEDGIPDDFLVGEPMSVPLFTSSARDRVLGAYYRLQGQLAATRDHRRAHQTPVEHARSLYSRSPELERWFDEVHRVFYLVLYADHEIAPSEAQRFESNCRRIHRILSR